jgi:hypothetical protein
MRKSSNINKLRSQLLLATLVLLIGTSALTSLTYAYIPGPYVHAAWFQNDPYPAESATIKIRYHCDVIDDYMYINLINPKGVTAQTWYIDTHLGYLYYSAPCGAGNWSLTCDVEGEITYRDFAYQLFNIPDSEAGQINLATDPLRHPQDPDILHMAFSVVDYPNSSLDAVHAICHHVHNTPTGGMGFCWRSDLDILDQYETTGTYTRWCQVAAVAVTSYARALGIPTRIIWLHVDGPEVGEPGRPRYNDGDWDHWFGECRIFNGISYEWIPFDGDVEYGGWCGWIECNTWLNYKLPPPNNTFCVTMNRDFVDATPVFTAYPPPILYSNA